ncbi:uncharacterized [Tachysurus ichikawai]
MTGDLARLCRNLMAYRVPGRCCIPPPFSSTSQELISTGRLEEMSPPSETNKTVNQSPRLLLDGQADREPSAPQRRGGEKCSTQRRVWPIRGNRSLATGERGYSDPDKSGSTGSDSGWFICHKNSN